MTQKISIFLLIPLLFFIGCNSSESPLGEGAEFQIALENNPATITFSESLQKWEFENCLLFSEVNGVGGSLEGIVFEAIGYGDVLFKKIYEGRKFIGFESWKICFHMANTEVMKSVQVTLLGTDDLGNRIDQSKVFFLTR